LLEHCNDLRSGALGSAVFAVILTHDLPFDAWLIVPPAAFATTSWWLIEPASTSLVGGAWLTVEQRRTRPPKPRTPPTQ
jgi:hypothetical protein